MKKYIVFIVSVIVVFCFSCKRNTDSNNVLCLNEFDRYGSIGYVRPNYVKIEGNIAKFSFGIRSWTDGDAFVVLNIHDIRNSYRFPHEIKNQEYNNPF